MTFKENCPDIRNSKVVDVVRELEKYGADVDIYDPWADSQRVPSRVRRATHQDSDAEAATMSRWWRLRIGSSASMGAEGVRRLCRKTHVLYDIKHVFPAAEVDGRL